MKIYINPDDKTTYIGDIHLQDEELTSWYKEVMRRFKEGEDDVYDVDEAYETGDISVKHLLSIFNFIKNKIGK